MNISSVKKRIHQLRKEIDYHNKLYYEESRNIISDFDYDKKIQELIKLEELHPEFKSASSPSVKVGGKITKDFNTFDHNVPMLSLSNTYF